MQRFSPLHVEVLHESTATMINEGCTGYLYSQDKLILFFRETRILDIILCDL